MWLHCRAWASNAEKSNNSSRFLRSIEWKDGRNPLHSVYFLSVQLGKKKLTMSHNRYLLLKRDNSNECNRNFTMCCFMNVNKSFCVEFLSCFPFRPQLGQYPNNMRPLNPKSIHLPILHELNLHFLFCLSFYPLSMQATFLILFKNYYHAQMHLLCIDCVFICTDFMYNLIYLHLLRCLTLGIKHGCPHGSRESPCALSFYH